MIKVYINGNDRMLDQVTPSWLREEIESRRKTGVAVCVRVVIQSGGLNLTLSTPACAASGAGGRQPTPQEKEIFDLWSKRGMNSDAFIVGQLNAFLNEVKHI